jgi:hypothetical protein
MAAPAASATAVPPPRVSTFRLQGLVPGSDAETTVKVTHFSDVCMALVLQGSGRAGLWIAAAKEGSADCETGVLLGERETSLFAQLVARRAVAKVSQPNGLLLGLGLASPLTEESALALANALEQCLQVEVG